MERPPLEIKGNRGPAPGGGKLWEGRGGKKKREEFAYTKELVMISRLGELRDF